jgi:cobaltochelatase CobN
MNDSFVFLTHADSDLAALSRGVALLPQGFAPVRGFSLQSLREPRDMVALLASELANARVVIVRVLGRLSGIPGWQALLQAAGERNQSLLVVSGTGEPNPELDAVSSVAPLILRETLAYLHAGGPHNLAQWLRFLSDHVLLTGYGFEPPVELPEHGIYHPALGETGSLESWRALHPVDAPVVGIAFYRAHRISGNLRFIDALVAALERQGLKALPVYTTSLRAWNATGKSAALALFQGPDGPRIDALINTTSFAIGAINPEGPTLPGWSITALTELDVPVFQAMVSGMELDQWQATSRGLNPLDTAMNVVIPEFDGRVITVPVSFKERHRAGGLEVVEYAPLLDRVERVVGIVAAQVRLRRRPRRGRRIAFIFTNSSAEASQIGNAVGLDAPASLLVILRAMRAAGYEVSDLPSSGDALMQALIDRGCYDLEQLTAAQCGGALARVSTESYTRWFADLPPKLRARMQAQWGAPPGTGYVNDGHLILAGLEFGNVVVALQPPRGYGMDPDAIYHQPDLPPTHHYYALYRWLREDWGAHAIVHVGKHGTLEWLPGKGVGLSADCFPDALLGDMPLFYPFIINDPGEGSQAKRRAHAVIVDHLTPPLTNAETYGALAQLAGLLDEYYQVETLDPPKVPLLQAQIWALVKESRLDQDLGLGEGPKEGAGPAEEFAHLLEDIDGYLCEIGAAQIRDGLHVMGQAPQGARLVDMLCALTRLPNIGVPGLPAEVARFYGLDFAELLEDKGKRLAGAAALAAPRAGPVDGVASVAGVAVVAGLARKAGRVLVTRADALEVIDQVCRELYGKLQEREFSARHIADVVERCLWGGEGGSDARAGVDAAVKAGAGGVGVAVEVKADAVGAAPRGTAAIEAVLRFACEALVPNLARTADEVGSLLRALDGRYVPAGPSGAPTRGMAHILPTGRNFYSVDPRSLPSQSAWRVGRQLAQEVLQRHLKETGRYPESVSISVWGTSAMRTHGDDVAEILALLGVRPIWQAENRQLTGVEAIPLTELGRPRIDVTTRISGFFRDAFPQLIQLIDQAVNAVIELDEPPEQNFVRKHYLDELASRVAAREDRAQANRSARYRVFGSKPGAYGAGILPLIQERNWKDAADFAAAYVNWGGYAYTAAEAGIDARTEFRRRLTSVEIALHNQDNREHDIFDSDDYLQFHGGLIATIRSLTGRKPRHYFGDTQNPDRAVVRDLQEEALRVFRSRVVNPKWLESIRRHGYKGALECTATVDYLFGFDATAELLDDWMYEELAQRYALDPTMQQFFQESNPWALHAIAERLLEAAQRQMWSAPRAEVLAALKDTYLQTEAALEERGESAHEVPSRRHS